MTARVRPILPALALACLLAGAWAVNGWGDLSALRLTDTDDVMRLQQVRDWIAGQPFFDMVQHRLGPEPGLLMHWSRIGDLVPAAIILALRGALGQHGAEVAAVVLWPALQFFAYLALVQAIARRLVPDAGMPALVLAALAYPVTPLFMPGRIDHHAMQLLLVLIQIRALVGTPSLRSGAVAGLAIAAGAAIGLETLPFAVVTGGVVVTTWLLGQTGAAARQGGLGLGVGIALTLLLPLAGQGGTCDTIRPLAPYAIAGALALTALSSLRRHRLAWALAVAGALAVLGWQPAQPCLAGPYATIDPLVTRLWLAHVEEAQPLAALPLAQIAMFAGLGLVGAGAGGWLAWQRRGPWVTLFAFQAASVALTLAQLRGVYLAAALAPVPVAALIVEYRLMGRLATVLGLWTVGAGLFYPIAVNAFAPTRETTAAVRACNTLQAMRRLAALPPGRVMASIDLGAWTIAATPHAAIAAPYHRNNAGNAAMYRFFLGPAERAEGIARNLGVTYVVLCPGDFAETGAVRAGTIAGGARPGWLQPAGAPNAVPAVFTISPRLSEGRPAR